MHDMHTFLRHDAKEKEPFVPDGLDCTCSTSVDKDGKVTHIFFVRRIPQKPSVLDRNETESTQS